MLTTETRTICRLGFKRCPIFASVGVYDHEKIEKQELLVTLEIEADISPSFSQDSLENTIDYLALLACCEETAHRRHYNLIENLASHMLDDLYACFPLKYAEALIEKPEAIRNGECCFVHLKRFFSE